MICSINPSENKEWLDYISQQQEATIFHHPAWLSVLHEQYRFDVFALCAVNEKGTINAGIPFCSTRSFIGKEKWISLPFSDHCVPLYNNTNSLNEIMEHIMLSQKANRISEVEIRAELPIPNSFAKDTTSTLHITPLSKDINKIFSTFKKTQVQQPILKAAREGLKAVVTNEQSAVGQFYGLHLQTRRRLGVPVQPRKFFDVFWEHIIKVNLGFIVLVFADSRCISAGLFSGFSRTLTYKYGASDETMFRLRPNNLMIWTAMQEAVKRGFDFFDFGKTDIHNDGLRNFKSGWGSKETPLSYSFFPVLPKSGIIPFVKDNVVGPIIRHLPTFVCRWSGELLYKYFA